MNASSPIPFSQPDLSSHSRRRMAQRGIGTPDILTTMQFGRKRYVRGALFHVIGRKEVRKAEKHGIDLSDCEGLHVLCSPDGLVLTVYRNRQLDLRQRKFRRHRRF
jgi:hypothetical protein